MGRSYLDEARTRELWAKIKTELSKKANSDTLNNYNTKEEVSAAISTATASFMTEDQVSSAIAQAISQVTSFDILIVDQLPEVGESGVFYFVNNGKTDSDQYNEYVWVNNKFELIGTTKIDLSQYWSKTELVAMTQSELEGILI